jgi:hypothetical protein
MHFKFTQSGFLKVSLKNVKGEIAFLNDIKWNIYMHYILRNLRDIFYIVSDNLATNTIYSQDIIEFSSISNIK